MTVKHNTVYPKGTMLAMGDVETGFTFYGPYKDHAEAFRWVTDNMHVGTIYKLVRYYDVRQDLC